MRSLLLVLLATIPICGCQPEPTPPSPTPTPAWELKLQEGVTHYEQQSYEDAAVALRETLDLMESQNVPEFKVTIAQERCTAALAKAGGFVESQELWRGMLVKNPDSETEAKRMILRAEKFMRLQGDELVTQAQADHAEGHPSKAAATLRAAIYLYQKAGGSETQETAALKLLEEFEGKTSPSPTPSEAPE